MHGGVAVLVTFVLGALLGWVWFGLIPGRTLRRAREEAEQIIHAARVEGEAARQSIELEAEKKARERREILDQEIADALADLKKDQQRLAKREDTLDKKLESLTEREKSLDRRDSQLKKLEDELAAMRVEL